MVELCTHRYEGMQTGKRGQKTEINGRIPLRRRKSALDSSAIVPSKEEEEEEEEEEKYSSCDLHSSYSFRIYLVCVLCVVMDCAPVCLVCLFCVVSLGLTPD
jgi:hypothetical protein